MDKILVFDDNPDLLEMFQILFTRYRYKVNTVNTKGLFMQQLQGNRPDVILLDIMLRDFDGRNLCKEVKENKETQNIPIILISADPNKLIDFKDCNADDFLEKPFNLEDLLTKIKSFLGSPALKN